MCEAATFEIRHPNLFSSFRFLRRRSFNVADFIIYLFIYLSMYLNVIAATNARMKPDVIATARGNKVQTRSKAHSYSNHVF